MALAKLRQNFDAAHQLLQARLKDLSQVPCVRDLPQSLRGGQRSHGPRKKAYIFMFVADYCHPRLASFSKLRSVNATNLAGRVLNCDYILSDVFVSCVLVDWGFHERDCR